MKLLAEITNPAILNKEFLSQENPLAAQIAVLWRTMVIIGALAALLYLIWGAFDWLISEGDAKKLEAARNKMLHAMAGLGFLAASVAIVYLINSLGIFGFNLLKIEWPTP
jgi:hypothetical protein